MKYALPLICNRCGECCKQGGECIFRGESWSLRKMPMKFTGTCELLTDNGECSIMQNYSTKQLISMGIVGTCNFPDWRMS